MTIFRAKRRAPRRRIFESVRSTDPSVLSQDEQRQRRRLHMSIHYTGTFNLVAEIEAVLAPLADRDVARHPHVVREVAVAVNELATDLGKLLAEREARRRAAGLGYEVQTRMVRLAVAAWERPTTPEITSEALRSGTWASVLTDHVLPLNEPLRDYLAHARPPGETGNAASVSERVEGALRIVDRAVRDAERRLDQLEAARTAEPKLSRELRRLGATDDELRQLADLGLGQQA
ncbi:hypothetical protein KUG88_18160 [Rhodococcus rhodochrous]|uniref:hypothetical protein n=1 Tax=Rhodococcus rhodochrous TaxID=1829 RepID=UPI001E544ECE|nr:hypothetical protein [Rhodococcus rhodochrous]MCB8912055.1 hypothetical protein [Rhodococcus rhodochrous]